MPRAMPRAEPVTRQARAAATRDRILAATEAVLAEGGELTMERLAERAHVSIGAIYKRFRGKDSLLPLLLGRVQAQQAGRVAALVADPALAGAGLGERIDRLLEGFAAAQAERRHLIRALVAGHWQSEDPAGNEARAAEVMGPLLAWLLERADEIRHPEPRLALSLGLFTTLQTLQTAVMLDRIPPTVGLARFVEEQARMFRAYLGLPPA